MYLSDKQLHEKLSELDIECPSGDPFDPDGQIKAASIDLRLSDIFWCPKPGAVIDLLKEKAIESQPHRFWTRKVLLPSQSLDLKPGQMVLGRVHEKLTIPNDCAGKFEGRSSFARLGLMVHCTGDYANPGYRGHMPLQLVNLSPQTLRIYPHMQICQLMLVSLTGKSLKKYGGTDVASKYMNDDGGPSKWWRDNYVKQLKLALARIDASEAIQQNLYSRLHDVDDEILERLAAFLSVQSNLASKDSDAWLLAFGKKEDSLKQYNENRFAIWFGLATLFISLAVGIYFVTDLTQTSKIIALVLAFASIIPTVLAYCRPKPHSYLASADVRALLSAGARALAPTEPKKTE